MNTPVDPIVPSDPAPANGAAAPALPMDAKGKFLDHAIESFYESFPCEQCSLYLYDDDTRELAMQAARGVEMFGKASIVLKLGEGLVGRALAERRAIYTEAAATMPGYIRHHNFPDDHLQTLLAIPLLSGKERIGVVALQRKTGTPFQAEEISDARIKAAELASAIQNATVLCVAAGGSGHVGVHAKFVAGVETVFMGNVVSKGCAIAESRHLAASEFNDLLAGKVDIHPEARRSLTEAVALVEKRIAAVSRTLDERLPEAASMLFESTTMMLRDENFIGRMKRLMAEGQSLVEAICTVSREFIALFSQSPIETIKEKAQDVEDLAVRLLECATQASPDDNSDAEPHIVVAERLLPYDVLRIAQGNVRGIVLVSGGSTAHVTLLVRSLKIPMMIVPEPDLLILPERETVIIDSTNSRFIVCPTADTILQYEQRLAAEHEARIGISPQDRTHTQDGTRIQLFANINIIGDIASAIEAKAEGIGLYRTEFPFIMRQTLPSESDQQAIYSRILERMPDKPVVFRTLDAGGDKVIPYLFKTQEENPALGLRSIRFSFRYPYILDQQLRAILRAIQKHQRRDVSIMFPMVSSLEEFETAKAHVASCLENVRAEIGGAEIIVPKVGTMLEIPSVVGIIDRLAEISDFFSIGTNDFVQYMLAVDRGNPNVSDLSISHHPAVLRALREIAAAALRHDTPISICGEMGRDPRYIPFFIGIGLRSLSLEPGHIPATQQLISRHTIADCEQYARDLLACDYVADIEKTIGAFGKKAAD
ncbi:MAG: phosphoenolpyruvate--protein phosphotransferase [Kiritimatiellia bacterium]|jgi:phosphotransferase system enzyme I (PtsP)